MYPILHSSSFPAPHTETAHRTRTPNPHTEPAHPPKPYPRTFTFPTQSRMRYITKHQTRSHGIVSYRPKGDSRAVSESPLWSWCGYSAVLTLECCRVVGAVMGW
ncbi:hypothetical protein K439DRAFT_1103210 [Ramaria rubella]|nr:hypothetical protein K439DRAFT_1103210 [Ramaria rubella]